MKLRRSKQPCLLPGEFTEILDRITGVEADGISPFHQFDNVNQLLTSLYIADVGLRAAQPPGQFDLAQAGFVAGFDQERPQGFVTRRVQGTDQSCLPG